MLMKSQPGTGWKGNHLRQIKMWVGKIPLEEGMATHSSILAWRISIDGGARPVPLMGSRDHPTLLHHWVHHPDFWLRLSPR